MAVTTVDENKLKELIKAAIVELVEERRDLFEGVLEEALEDIGLAYAIQAGERTPTVDRAQVFEALEAA